MMISRPPLSARGGRRRSQSLAGGLCLFAVVASSLWPLLWPTGAAAQAPISDRERLQLELAEATVSDLAWIIRGYRPGMSTALRADLGEPPPWPNRCSGVAEYFGNLGAQFRSLCGSVVQGVVDKVRTDCTAAMQSPHGLAGNLSAVAAGQGPGAPKCIDNVLTAPYWTSKLAECTVTSYLGAFQMSQQDRDDLAKRVKAVTSIQTLMAFRDIFALGELEDLLQAGPPSSLDEGLALLGKAQKIGEQEKKRYERIAAIPSHLEPIIEAMFTFPTLRRNQIDALSDEAVSALDACEPERARDLYTMAKLEMLRHVQHLQANLAIAEQRFYCYLGSGTLWQSSKPWQRLRLWQGQSRDLRPPGSLERAAIAKPRRDWDAARRELREGLWAYEALQTDPRLEAKFFAAAELRRRTMGARLEDLAQTVGACVRTCGRRAGECPLSFAELEAKVARDVEGDRCARSVARQNGILAGFAELGVMELAKDAIRHETARPIPEIRALLHRCVIGSARSALAKIEQNIQWLPLTDSRPQCYEPLLNGVREGIDLCEEICAMPSIRGCGDVGVSIERVERGR